MITIFAKRDPISGQNQFRVAPVANKTAIVNIWTFQELRTTRNRGVVLYLFASFTMKMRVQNRNWSIPQSLNPQSDPSESSWSAYNQIWRQTACFKCTLLLRLQSSESIYLHWQRLREPDIYLEGVHSFRFKFPMRFEPSIDWDSLSISCCWVMHAQ